MKNIIRKKIDMFIFFIIRMAREYCNAQDHPFSSQLQRVSQLCAALQSQKPVSAYFTGGQLLTFDFAHQFSSCALRTVSNC